MLALEITDARKHFGDVVALAGVSLAAGPGEIVGLLGPNGAGKTTLIRAIAGRVVLDAGGIRVFGRTLGPRDARPELGVVPQELAIYPLLTARENLEVFGRLYGVAAADLRSRVDWALEWADLQDRARTPTRTFSGGMKRRLNIACGLLHRPSLLLLDEPTVGVDPQSRERIYEMLAVLQREGLAILLTTHQLEEAQERCARVVIIDRGRTVASGTVRELVTQTLGTARALTAVLTTALRADVATPDGIALSDDRRTLRVPIDDGNVERAAGQLLGFASAQSASVHDLSLGGASLQDVFIALTGRELRE